MGQIVKRKKKGRPSKADIARRSRDSPAKFEPVVRRSLRRRSVRYNIDFDDYLDEDDDDEEEHESRRLKKLKLVVKLNQDRERADSPEPGRARTGSRGDQTQEYGASASEDDIPERKPLKKRIIGRREEEDEDEDDDKSRVDEDEDNDCVEERGRTRNVSSKGSDSVPGTPSDTQNAMPLPDKRTMELILDKLQKKDIYGVYAEPVDPEELPDYHEVVEHPMDFATVRKKLANGTYSTMEEFESDVFLICSNAMQYNAPETIYYKQANTILELAKKKFGRLRINFESSGKELKLEQDTKSNFLVKKQTKRLLCRTSQEPIGSDFSSGATLATTTGIQNLSCAIQGGGYERPSNTDGHVEGNSSPFDTNLEKIEEQLSGKGFSSRLGRKAIPLDENRPSTYNISNEPVVESDSIFSTFEGETRQLVAVGLHSEYSYARSLARFAATLGPVAWRVASKTIEQALPDGCKFGRGWVGEYEPLPTPVLMIQNFNQKESGLFTNLHSTTGWRKDERTLKIPCLPTIDHRTSNSPSELRQSLFDPPKGHTPDGKPPFFGSDGTRLNNRVNSISQQQANLPSNSFSKPENVKNQVELNLLPSANHSADTIVEKHFPRNLNVAASRSKDVAPVNVNLVQSASFKRPDSNGAVCGKWPNGKIRSNCSDNQMASPSSNNVHNHIARGVASYSHGQQVTGLSDPVQLMQILAEKAKNQQKSSNQPPIKATQVISSAPSIWRDPNTAAAEAARAWMSIGASITPKNHISADSLYNPSREFHSQITKGQLETPRPVGNQFHRENSFPSQAFAPQPQIRPVVFPHFAPADLSKFQVQSHWRALSPHTHIRQKPDMLPPDLNISFQSPGSPARQSSGVLVDSQQPDLALQL